MGTDRSSFLVKSIDTEYSGYLFRSRLEARWAVFFDALGVKYQYEPEGFELEGGERYLPDFWLPDDGAFVEIKGDKDAVTKHEVEKAKKLDEAGKHRVFIAAGDPVERRIARPYAWWFSNKEDPRYSVNFEVCPVCDKPGIDELSCGCVNAGWGTNRWDQRIKLAALVARRARFEFGSPRRIERCERRIINGGRVYLAGKVHDDFVKADKDKDHCQSGWLRWRSEIFREVGEHKRLLYGTNQIMGPWTYGGPNIGNEHGMSWHSMVSRECLDLIQQADAVFAWLDSGDAHGTLVEIGYAKGRKKIFVAFANDELSRQLWFAQQVADASVVVPNAKAAWRVFENWWNRAT